MKNTIRSAAAIALMALGAISAQAQVQSAESGFAPDIANAQSTLSRQQVSNAYDTAQKAGTLQLNGGDAYRPVNDIRGTSSALTRAQVQSEAVAFNHNGGLLAGEGSVQ